MTQTLNLGNIISPSGASVVYGPTATDDKLGVQGNDGLTYSPYTIVFTDEPDDPIQANSIVYDNTESNLESKNVQDAINELETVIYNTMPVFSQEIIQITSANQSEFTLEKTFSKNAMMVFYNGLLINESIHYNYNDLNNTISLIDFVTENGDIITVIGLAPMNSINEEAE